MTDVPTETRSLATRWLVAVAALVGAAAHWFIPKWVDLPQNPGGAGLGPSVSSPVLQAVALLAATGAVLSFRFRAVGAAVIGTAALVSGFVVLWEFRSIVGLLTLSLAGPAVLLFAPSGSGPKPSTRGRRAALLAILSSSLIIWRSVNTWGGRYGATHPESAASKPDWLADWLWVGGVDGNSAIVTAGGLRPSQPHRLLLWTANAESEGTDAMDVEVVTDLYGIARFDIDDLDPGTNYRYRVEPETSDESVSRNVELMADSSFHTPPDDLRDVTIAFGSCARTGSNGAVFDTIRAQDPDLFINVGDLHYGNIVSSDPADHLLALGRSISTPAQSALFSSVPTAWVWDDHDFGDNDSDSTSPSRAAVADAYRRAVPHWGVDLDPSMPINQAFTIGNVRVVVSDTRSHRAADTMLGAEQEAWLIDELTRSSRTHDAVIWANPAPWNVPDRPGSDQWGAFPDERRRIANAIAAAMITNLVMISGDFHFSAIDDGTNTAYADDGTRGFPLLHGGPLDRPEARTSDTYSHGVFSNAGQFGTVRVIDVGGATTVVLTSHLWNGETLGQLTIDFG